MVTFLGMLLLWLGCRAVELNYLFDMRVVTGQFTSDEETTASGRNTRLSFLLTTEWQENDIRDISRTDFDDKVVKMHGWWANWYPGFMSSDEPAKGEAVYYWTEETTPRGRNGSLSKKLTGEWNHLHIRSISPISDVGRAGWKAFHLQ